MRPSLALAALPLAASMLAASMLAPAWAAPSQVLSTAPGADLRLGVFAVVRKDCSTGEAPEIRISRAPMHGIIVLQSVTLSTKRVQNCPVVTAPARQITYRPTPGFTGQDEVTFDVVDSATKQSDLHPVTIAVQAPPAKP